MKDGEEVNEIFTASDGSQHKVHGFRVLKGGKAPIPSYKKGLPHNELIARIQSAGSVQDKEQVIIDNLRRMGL